MLNRRDAIKLGSVAGAVLALPAGRLASALTDDPPIPPPFSVPLWIPPVLRPTLSTPNFDVYRIRISETDQEILPGVRTRTLTYQGCFPGPTIKARRGRRAVVIHTNAMPTETVVHLHGGNVAPRSDGHPMDTITPGRSRWYDYPNIQPAATLWYHDHTHHPDEPDQVYLGLAGAYLISDDTDDRLPLPRGRFDVPLIIRDARFNGDGQFVYIHDDVRNRPTILVNGRPQPYFDVQARRYRLRLVNGSNLARFMVKLSNDRPMVQIAVDGGFLPKPVPRQEIELWPAERAEVIVDFSGLEGTHVVLQNTYFTASETKREIMQFRVGPCDSPDRSSIPERLVDDVRPRAEIARVRRFELSTTPDNIFLLNGQRFDPNVVNAVIKHGTTEIWEIANKDPERIPHTMHPHLVHFRVLTRNGAPELHDAYPKDNVRLYPNDVVRIQATFDSFTGRYLLHCHFIDHSKKYMMGQFEVVP